MFVYTYEYLHLHYCANFENTQCFQQDSKGMTHLFFLVCFINGKLHCLSVICTPVFRGPFLFLVQDYVFSHFSKENARQILNKHSHSLSH